jgi:phosphoglycolate phosphatase
VLSEEPSTALYKYTKQIYDFMPHHKRLLLFDIDGTLVSVEREASRRMLRRVVEETFETTLPDDFMFQLGGKTDDQIMTETLVALGLPVGLAREKRERAHELLTEYTTPLSNPVTMRLLESVQPLIQQLAADDSVQLGLLTGNIKRTAMLKLQPHGLDSYFPFGAFGCDHIERAMLPPIALDRANTFAGNAAENTTGTTAFTPENTVIIGDTLNDIRCAKAHGIKVLAVATGNVAASTLLDGGADKVVENFADTASILALIKQF